MTTHFELDIYSHYFTIKNPDLPSMDIIFKLSEDCTQRGYIRSGRDTVYGVVKIFNSVRIDGTEYRYHISLLDKLRQYVLTANFPVGSYKVTKHPVPEPTVINAPIREGWVPRDYQVPVIEYIKNSEKPTCFVGLGTGKGKSSIAMMAISQLKMKTLILIKPTYMDKWSFDVSNILDVPKERVNSIKGSTSLMELIELNLQGKDQSDFIIMSLPTYHNYICLYEKFGKDMLELGYGCLPEDFLNVCGVGVVLMDEVHQLYHQQFQSMLYMNIHKLIALSATFYTKDRSLETMYELGIPIKDRYKETLDEKYIYVTAISYSFIKPEKIRYTEYNSNMYSQTAFEKSIMRHVPTKNHYLEMVSFQVEKAFIDRYKPGDKCLIFAGSINMCIELRDKLRAEFPELWIEKYTSEDPYDYAMKPDIRVSTLGSFSTGLDLPNLTTVIMTVNIDSIQSSRQAIGRLRKIPDRDVYFYYLYCNQIDKHVRVHLSKRKTYSHIAKMFNERHYPRSI